MHSTRHILNSCCLRWSCRMLSGTPRQLPVFKAERYFAWDEAPNSLTCSDLEPLEISDVISLEPEDSALRHEWDSLSLKYTYSQGCARLRTEIAQEYVKCSAEDVVVLAPQEGIYLSMLALLKPGDHVVCCFPAYQSLFEVARSIGCTVDLWKPRQLSEENEKNEGEGEKPFFCPKDLKKLVKPGLTKAICCNFPHNPTGALPSHSDWEKVIEICRNNESYLFSDEMYRRLEHVCFMFFQIRIFFSYEILYLTNLRGFFLKYFSKTHDPKSILPAACDIYEKGISLSGMSKVYSMPGVRLGWLAFPNESIEILSVKKRVMELKDYTTICAASPSEFLSLIALRNREKIITRNRKILLDGLYHVRNFVKMYPNIFQWSEPLGGPFVFPLIHRDFLLSKWSSSTEEYCTQLAYGTSGIMLLPSVLYDFGDSRVRITFSRKNTKQLLDLWKHKDNGYFLKT